MMLLLCATDIFGVSGALTGIFSQILQGDEQIRERAITFLSTKIRVLLVEDLLPKDAEEELVALCKKVKYRVLQKTVQWSLLVKKVPYISQGSVTTHLRCGGICNVDDFVAILLPSPMVKEFREWVSIWQKLRVWWHLL